MHGHLGEMKGVTAVFGERMSAPPLLLSLTGGPGRTVTKGLVSGVGWGGGAGEWVGQVSGWGRRVGGAGERVG